MRCLIEVLTENMRYSEAIKRIDEAKQIFSGETDLWEIYETWIQWRDGEKDKARARWEYLSNNNLDNYLIQLMIAEVYAKASEYDLALMQYEQAFAAQHEKRKIDPLICQVKIYDIIGNTDEALVRVKRIQEVLLKDYRIEEGSEVKVWKEREKILMKSLEEK